MINAEYRHTSVIRTIRERWQLGAPLTARDAPHRGASRTGVEITLTLSLRGPLAPLVYAVMGRLSRRYLTMEMEGFRRTAESVRN